MAKKNKEGFTLAELLISMSILAMIVALTFSIYVRFFDSLQNVKAANLVYEEARFLMDRIIKEVRNGTIDYEEYYNQSLLKNQFPDSYNYLRNESYAQNYCQYNRQFYNTGLDSEIGTFDDESIGLRSKLDSVDGITPVPPAIGILDVLDNDIANPIQKDLFIINVAGDQRTFIKRTEKTDNLGNTIGKISLLKMEGKDFGSDHLNAYDPYLDGSAPGVTCDEDMGEGDGNIDTWICMDGFPCERKEEINADLCEGIIHKVIYDPQNPEQNSFVDISPDSLDIVDVTFFVSPMDDPRKAYRNNSIQIQPNITIRLTVQAAPALAAKYDREYNPNIILESSVSARAYNEIRSECNLKQCTPGQSPDRDCPLTAGVCGPNAGSSPAQQSCTDFIWPGCSSVTYQNYADNEWGMDNLFPGGARTYFEDGSEYRSCDEELSLCLSGCAGDSTCINNCNDTANICKEWRCNDGMDNDCSGAADNADAACNVFLCNDGLHDPLVESAPGCIDVGGLCEPIRPQQLNESLCNDGHDNDCDGYADQFDADCVIQLCSNGNLDPNGTLASYLDSPAPLFFRGSSISQNYLLDETSPQTDAGLNETATDIGGLCALCFDSTTGNGACPCGTSGCSMPPILPEQTSQAPGPETLCYDGLDNDVDGNADELDSDCQAILCQDNQQNCDLAPNSHNPSGYLGDYNDATCLAPPLNLNDEACVDIGGVCDGYVDGSGGDHTYLAGGESTAPACTDNLDNDCDGTADWQETDGSCCAFTPYCMNNNSSTFSDFLESSDYIFFTDSGINHNPAAGEISLTDPGATGRVISENIPLEIDNCTSYQVNLAGSLANLPGSSDIRFFLSDDGGNTWCGNNNCSGDSISTGELNSNITFNGSQLRWMAELNGDGTHSPILNQINLNYSNCI